MTKNGRNLFRQFCIYHICNVLSFAIYTKMTVLFALLNVYTYKAKHPTDFILPPQAAAAALFTVCWRTKTDSTDAFITWIEDIGEIKPLLFPSKKSDQNYYVFNPKTKIQNW